MSSLVRLLIQKLFGASDEGFKITSYVATQTRYLHSIKIWRVIVPLQAFADSTRGGIITRHVQCAQSPMHLVESAAPSGGSRLHSSMNFGSRN